MHIMQQRNMHMARQGLSPLFYARVSGVGVKGSEPTNSDVSLPVLMYSDTLSIYIHMCYSAPQYISGCVR